MCLSIYQYLTENVSSDIGCNPMPFYSEVHPVKFDGAYSHESVFRIAAMMLN